MEEKTLKKNIIFEGKVLSLRVDEVELSNGHICTREVVEQTGGVCIAPINDNNELIFVKQYRYPVSSITLELPAGKLEGEKPDPLQHAKRELLEETGIIGKDYFSLGSFYTSQAVSTDRLYLFGCRVEKIIKPTPDEDEILEVCNIHMDKALNMVLSGEIMDAKTQIAILKLHYKIKNV